MPGLRPPQPDSYDDDDDNFYVEFNFMRLQARDDGQILPVMTFDQITDMLAGIEAQLDGDELAEVIIAQLRDHLKNFKRGLG